MYYGTAPILNVHPITVYSYIPHFFNCVTVIQASDTMSTWTKNLHQWAGALCLSLAGAMVAHLRFLALAVYELKVVFFVSE